MENSFTQQVIQLLHFIILFHYGIINISILLRKCVLGLGVPITGCSSKISTHIKELGDLFFKDLDFILRSTVSQLSHGALTPA